MIRLAAVFTDRMVLQREKPIRLFGEADEGARVTAQLAGFEASAVARDGRFLLELPALPAGGPHTLSVFGGEERITLDDILIGEVWLCGGQSNMAYPLRDDEHAETVLRTGHPLVRYYVVSECGWLDEAALAAERQARWQPLAPGAGGELSAVGCYAAMELANALGVPVGLIACCVGGTPITCWMGQDALANLPEARIYLDEFERNVAGKSDEQYAQEDAAYRQAVDAWCESQARLLQENPAISPGEIDARIGPFPWPPPWGRQMPRRPSGFYEAMLLRVAPVSLRGFLYYQGETDSAVDRAPGYAALFSALIAQWRAVFDDPSLWFISCQLPGYGSDPAAEDWGAIRAAQRRVADKTPLCALACLIDCGERDNLHPRDKRLPGERLAALALRYAYGHDVPADAPRLESAHADGARVTLAFAHTGGGIRLPENPASFLRAKGASILSARAQGDALALTLDAPARGVTLSYARENFPQAVLFGENGLPLEPFEVTL